MIKNTKLILSVFILVCSILFSLNLISASYIGDIYCSRQYFCY